ncbi:hypothetical protein [Rhodopirellula halodulae]|nr:hypothetical protein [Rhodopirellula sp. JC740]
MLNSLQHQTILMHARRSNPMTPHWFVVDRFQSLAEFVPLR